MLMRQRLAPCCDPFSEHTEGVEAASGDGPPRLNHPMPTVSSAALQRHYGDSFWAGPGRTNSKDAVFARSRVL